MTDQELLARYSSTGSPEAFAEIVGRYSAMVYSTCLRVTGDGHQAEDSTQAVFLVLIRKACALPRGTALPGWLFRTAEHVARRARRTDERRRRRESEAAQMRTAGTDAPNDLWAGIQPHFDAALATLPANQRDVIVLRYLRGLREMEICRETGLGQSTVAMRISSGLDKLRKLLARQGAMVPAAALGGMLGERAIEAVPAGLAASVSAACAGKASVSATAVSLAEGTMKAMLWAKVKLVAAVVGAVALAGAGGGLAARHLLAGEYANTAPVPGAPGGLIRTACKGSWDWYEGAGSAGLAEKLFAAAAEVAGKTGQQK